MVFFFIIIGKINENKNNILCKIAYLPLTCQCGIVISVINMSAITDTTEIIGGIIYEKEIIISSIGSNNGCINA